MKKGRTVSGVLITVAIGVGLVIVSELLTDKEMIFVSYYTRLLVSLLSPVFVYLSLRSLILDIVWCDFEGEQTYERLERLYPGFSLMRMRCLLERTHRHSSNFLFWMRIKDCFWICEAAVALAVFSAPLYVTVAQMDIIAKIYSVQIISIVAVIPLRLIAEKYKVIQRQNKKKETATPQNDGFSIELIEKNEGGSRKARVRIVVDIISSLSGVGTALWILIRFYNQVFGYPQGDKLLQKMHLPSENWLMLLVIPFAISMITGGVLAQKHKSDK